MEININTPTGTPHEIVCGAIETALAVYPMVEEFHEVYGHPVRLNKITSSLLKLRGSLICEEARHEGMAALEKGDLTSFLDALADSLYVEMGSLVVMNGGIEHALGEPTGGSPLDCCDALTTPATTQTMTMAMMFSGWIGDGFELMAECDDRETVEDALPLLCCGLYVSLQLKMCVCRALGINLVELVRAVHESNMTKLWPSDEQQLREAVAASKYDEADLEFRPCISRPGLVGYRKTDGKILKSPTYTEVDLSAFAATAEKSELWRTFTTRRG